MLSMYGYYLKYIIIKNKIYYKIYKIIFLYTISKLKYFIKIV